MIMENRFFMLSAILFFSCSSSGQIDIENTRWERELDSGCISYWDFESKGDCEFYNCNFEKIFSGTYEFNQDTLVLKELDYVSQSPINRSYEKEVKYVYKYIIRNDSLIRVYYEDVKYERKVVGLKKNFFYRKSK